MAESSGIEPSLFHQLSIAINQASRSPESLKASNGNAVRGASEHREASSRSSRTPILLDERGSPELQAAAGPSRDRCAAAHKTAGTGDGGEADSESDGGEIRPPIKNGKPRRPSPRSKPKASAPSEKKRQDRVSSSPPAKSKGEEKRKEDGTAKAVSASNDKHTKEKKRRRKRKYSSDEDEEDEVKHLKSNLNADAFAKSSGTNSRSAFSAKLKKFKQARTGLAVDSSASSSEDSDSDSVSSSSSSSFIAKEDEVELEDGKRVKSKNLAPPLQPPRFHDTLPAFQRNMSLDAACSLYIRWLVLTMVEQLPTKGNDLAEMEAVRKRLQQHAEDSRQIINSAALRRRFTFYLAKYPKLERPNLSNLAKTHTHTGCAACHRSKQLCTDRLTFSGPLYHDEDLNKYGSSSDEELSSDMSTDAEDQMSHEAKEPRKPVKGEGARKLSAFHICYAGPHCADRAMVLHKISHWEYNMLQSVNRCQPMKDLRQVQKPSKRRVVRDGEVNPIVNAKKGELKTLMATLRAQDNQSLEGYVRMNAYVLCIDV